MNIYYKIHHLGKDNNLKKVYVFVGNLSETDKIKLITEDNSFKGIKQDDIIFLNEMIYPDDTIDIIKKKLIKNLTDISYYELHMFVSKNNIVSGDEIVNYLMMNRKMRDIHSIIMKHNFVENKDKKNIVIDEEQGINFKELTKINFDEGKKCYECIDKIYKGTNRFMNVVINPHLLTNKNQLLSISMINNNQSLMLDNGIIEDNIIYVTDYNSVMETIDSIDSIELERDDIIRYYFPQMLDFDMNKDNMLKKEKEIMSVSEPYMKMMNKYYNYYIENDGKKVLDNDGLNIGFEKIEIIISNEMKSAIPIEQLFKHINSSEKYPAIKMITNMRTEKLIRFYSPEETKSGIKLPYLSMSEIFKVVKLFPNNERGVYIYRSMIIDEKPGSMIICFLDDGRIKISCVFPVALSIETSEKLIKDNFDEFMNYISGFLYQQGKKLIKFPGFSSLYVDIRMYDYCYYIKKVKLKNLPKLKTNFTNIFEYKKENDSKLNIYDFKKHPLIIALNREDRYPLFEVEVLLDYIKFSFKDICSIEYLKTIPVYLFFVKMLLEDKISKDEMSEFMLNKKQQTKLLTEQDKVEQEINIEYISDNEQEYDNIDDDEFNNIFSHTKTEDNIGKLDDDLDGLDGLDGLDEVDDIDDLALLDEEENEALDLDLLDFDEEQEGGKRRMWVDRIEKRDNIFDKFKYEKQNAYSRTCPSNQNRQPVIVTKEELDKINNEHPGSYYPEEGNFSENPDKKNFALRFHSDKSKEFYYICPKFWCLDENVALNPTKDLVFNKDGKTLYRDNEGNVKSKKEGFCQNIYEFGVKYSQSSSSDDSIIDDNGKLKKNAFNYPSFKDDNYCLPCCFKYSDRTPLDFKNPQKKANKCMESLDIEIKDKVNKDMEDIEENKKENENKNIKSDNLVLESSNIKGVNQYYKILNVILQSDKFPLPQFRAGYLNMTLQEIFKKKDMVCDVNSKKSFDCFLRVGVEENDLQSFIGAMAVIFKYGVLKEKTITIKEFKNRIIDNLSIDQFIQLQNGNLIKLFSRNDNESKSSLESIKNSLLYQRIDVKNSENIELLEYINNSYIRFKNHMLRNDVLLDHTILWDLMCMPLDYLFENGMNLVILEGNEENDNNYINMLCPSNYYSSMNKKILSNRSTVVLYKLKNHYEPIANIKRINGKDKVDFFINNDKDNGKDVNTMIEKFNSYYGNCYPVPSIPSKFDYDKNVLRFKDDIINLLKKKKYDDIVQVVNKRGKVIGLHCKKGTQMGMIPCYPSYLNTSYKFVMYDNKSIYTTYEKTLKFLSKVYKESESLIYVYPPKKVVLKNNVVGFLTPLNHFVSITPSVLDMDTTLEKSNILMFDKEDEFMDTLIYQYKNKEDTKRILVRKKIQLEQFIYTMFRHKFKILLEDQSVIDKKIILNKIIDSKFIMYNNKLKMVISIINKLMKDEYIFVDKFDDNFILKLDITNESSIMDNIYDNENRNFKVIISKKNLLTGEDNEKTYFNKLADEIIRYKSMSEYILNSDGYLTSTNDEYIINKDEVIIPQSIISKEYLSRLEKMSSFKHPYENIYDNVNPFNGKEVKKTVVEYKDKVALKKRIKLKVKS